jgi:hypothetical protein
VPKHNFARELKKIVIIAAVVYTAVYSAALDATGEDSESCAGTVQVAFDKFDRSQFQEMMSELLGISEDEQASAAEWLRLTIREYGYPEDRTLDPHVDLEAYTTFEMATRLPPPHEIFKYRTIFAHEGEGLIVFKTAKIDSECRITTLSFMLPKSRPDATRRHHEIARQVGAGLASFAE